MIATTKEIVFAQPWVTDEERDAALEVLERGVLTQGSFCEQFEDEFASFLGEGAHCVAVSSGMAAMHLTFLHFGLGPGDEVVVPAQSHVGAAHAVEWVGAKPVFADCDPKTGNMTSKAVEAALTPRTRAIAVVHFLGNPTAMPEIVDLAEKRRLWVVEDCSLALGAKYDAKHVGLYGDAGCFSFGPASHIATGEGGMFVSRHEGAAQAVAAMRTFGEDARRGVHGRFVPCDVPALGLNYRLGELQAAVGSAQLGRLQENLARRRKNAAVLRAGLSKVKDIRILGIHDVWAEPAYACLEVVLEGPLAKRRDELMGLLADRDIGTGLFYPNPAPRMAYYRAKYGFSAGSYPHAEKISDSGLAFPVGPHLDQADMLRIADEFKTLVGWA